MADSFRLFPWPPRIRNMLGITTRRKVQVSSDRRFLTEASASVVCRPITPMWHYSCFSSLWILKLKNMSVISNYSRPHDSHVCFSFAWKLDRSWLSWSPDICLFFCLFARSIQLQCFLFSLSSYKLLGFIFCPFSVWCFSFVRDNHADGKWYYNLSISNAPSSTRQ
jgi:hypothetical protein